VHLSVCLVGTGWLRLSLYKLKDSIMYLLDRALAAIGSKGHGLRLLHVGTGRGGEIPSYLAYGIEPIGIDGNAESIAFCEQRYPTVKFYNCVVSSENELLTWHSTSPPECASIHEIDEEVAKAHFPKIRLLESSLVSCTTVDTLALPQIDIIVVDAQGHDYEVLVGAKETLTNCSFVICEVWLKTLYKDTTLFDDVVSFMSSLGFVMYYFQPGSTPAFWGDALFVRRTQMKQTVKPKKPAVKLVVKPAVKPKVLPKRNVAAVSRTRKDRLAKIKQIVTQRKKLLAKRNQPDAYGPAGRRSL